MKFMLKKLSVKCMILMHFMMSLTIYNIKLCKKEPFSCSSTIMS